MTSKVRGRPIAYTRHLVKTEFNKACANKNKNVCINKHRDMIKCFKGMPVACTEEMADAYAGLLGNIKTGGKNWKK
jgi:hypothetical protein